MEYLVGSVEFVFNLTLSLITNYSDRETALNRVGERIEQFLPQEEQDKRRRADRAAKWAINVRELAFLLQQQGITEM